MSTFAVNIRQITTLDAIKDADAIQAVQINDCSYWFVVRKGDYKVGDLVAWLPLDALLPEIILRSLGFWDEATFKGTLSGSHGNRIKTKRLRGQLSQGIICKPQALFLDISDEDVDGWFETQENLADLWEVTKYDPPEHFSVHARAARTLPGDIPFYDIENAESHPAITRQILAEPYVVIEKVEGSNFALKVTSIGEVAYFSRRQWIIDPTEDHAWRKAVVADSLLDKASQLLKALGCDSLVLRGEIIGPGVQGNYYQFPDHKVYMFDIMVNGAYVDYSTFRNMCISADLRHCPQIGDSTSTPLVFEDVVAFSNGKSEINRGRLREGIVIRRLVETSILNWGRAQIKQRDPVYLEKFGD